MATQAKAGTGPVSCGAGRRFRRPPKPATALSCVVLWTFVIAFRATAAAAAASATGPPSPIPATPGPSDATTQASDEESGGESEASAALLVIVCAVAAIVAVGVIGLYWLFLEKRGKHDDTDSFPLSCPAKESSMGPLADSSTWPAMEEGEAGGGFEQTANPMYAMAVRKPSGARVSGRASTCDKVDEAVIDPNGSGSTTGASTISDGVGDDGEEGSEVNDERKTPFRDNISHPSEAQKQQKQQYKGAGNRKRRVVPSLSSLSSMGGSELDFPTGPPPMETIPVSQGTSAPAALITEGPTAAADDTASAITKNASKQSQAHAALGASLPRPVSRKPLARRHSVAGAELSSTPRYGSAFNPRDAAPSPAKGPERRFTIPVEGHGRQNSVGRWQPKTGASVYSVAEGVVRGAEALACESFVPGVKEVAAVVAGLARLAAADHRGNAGDMEERVSWCRAVVLTLERARDVLGKSSLHDREAERILLEDVQESIRGMAEVVQSYKYKHMVREVFFSSLCQRRQVEAEAAIASALEYLEDIVLRSIKKRRRRNLDQVDISAGDVQVMTDESLGVGGFGTVYLADFNGRNAAAKVVFFKKKRRARGRREDGDSGDDDEELDYSLDQKQRRREAVANAKKASAKLRAESRQRSAFLRDLDAMKRLRGPHTVSLYGAVTSLQDRFVLVMELLPGGNLRQRLRKAKGPLNGDLLRRIVKDVCSGMAFLHAEAFVHGDLKSASVLFDAAGTAKIGDLGTSLWTQRRDRFARYSFQKGGLMSLPWAAPEVLIREGATSKSDVFSFGVVVWECLTRQLPWRGITSVSGLVFAVTEGERPIIPDDAPADLASLTRACWTGDASSRPSLERVLVDLEAREGSWMIRGSRKTSDAPTQTPTPQRAEARRGYFMTPQRSSTDGTGRADSHSYGSSQQPWTDEAAGATEGRTSGTRDRCTESPEPVRGLGDTNAARVMRGVLGNAGRVPVSRRSSSVGSIPVIEEEDEERAEYDDEDDSDFCEELSVRAAARVDRTLAKAQAGRTSKSERDQNDTGSLLWSADGSRSDEDFDHEERNPDHMKRFVHGDEHTDGDERKIHGQQSREGSDHARGRVFRNASGERATAKAEARTETLCDRGSTKDHKEIWTSENVQKGGDGTGARHVNQWHDVHLLIRNLHGNSIGRLSSGESLSPGSSLSCSTRFTRPAIYAPSKYSE